MIAWQEPPPYVQFMEEAEQVGRMSYAAGVCTGMGILNTSEERVRAAADDFQRRAVIARAWGPVVEEVFLSGISQERQEHEFMSDIPETLSGADVAMRRQRYEEFITERCGWVLREFPNVATLQPR